MSSLNRIAIYITSIILIIIFFTSCKQDDSVVRIANQLVMVEYDSTLYSKITSKYHESHVLMTSYQPSEYLLTGLGKIEKFRFISANESPISENAGDGLKMTITGIAHLKNATIEKKLVVKIYDDFPDMVFTQVIYNNIGETPIQVDKWINNHYSISAGVEKIPFWSFQGGSYEQRPDWVLPVKPGFSQENYMGMNATDYGGGIPVSDVWRKDGGLAVGHVEKSPRLVSLPVDMKTDTTAVSLSLVYNSDYLLPPGEKLTTFQTFITVHKGDFWHPLEQFGKYMRRQGMTFPSNSKSAYEPIWCAWGYERDFTVKEIIGTLPKVKELGFKWAVLDDGWQTAEGDWFLNRKKFPRGDADMKDFVHKIHQAGLKAKLWWAPLAVDSGTVLIREHPDMLLINKEGKTQDISWWDSYYLCPAYSKTKEYTKKLVEKIMNKWGYQGLKIDGQHLNGVPPCYNPAHHHRYPEESVEKLPEFFAMIYKTALEINPDAVIEICPCGTVGSFYNMPYMNQAVSSDPESSWQIRLKGKTYRALMGPKAAYYGDHVELSDIALDFASTIGIGGVIGTKFTWPKDNHPEKNYTLIPEKEKIFRQWMEIYNRYSLPEGDYLGGLYDIGFDIPETHVIRRNNNYYYAFYAKSFKGGVRFRGLPDGIYTAVDYEKDRKLGQVESTHPVLDVNFKNHLLVLLKKNRE